VRREGAAPAFACSVVTVPRLALLHEPRRCSEVGEREKVEQGAGQSSAGICSASGSKGAWATSTYSFCFFLGPGFPLTLGSPLPFAAAAAFLLTPFFLGPSAGGPMVADWAAGVPAGGELGVESDAFSVLELGTAAGDCLTGVSSLTKSGSTMARSFWDGTLRVTTRLALGDGALVTAAAAVLLDLRRSLAAAAFLLEGAITADKIACDAVGGWSVVDLDGWMRNDDDGHAGDGVVKKGKLALSRVMMLWPRLDGSGDGRSTGWACKGRTQSAWGENVPYRLLASHFYFASATTALGLVRCGRR